MMDDVLEFLQSRAEVKELALPVVTRGRLGCRTLEFFPNCVEFFC